MKKQISLVLVVCLGLSPFSLFAQVSTAQYASLQAQINNQYLKALEEIKQQELENLQRLRQQYQEQQKLLMMQLNQASQDVSDQSSPELGVATAADAVTLRKQMQDKKASLNAQYKKSMAHLKETFSTQQKQVMDIYQDAKQNAKKQLNAFLSSAKTNGQAAVDAAVSSFARFGSAVGQQGARLIDKGRSAFNAVRNTFNRRLIEKGLAIVGAATIGGLVTGSPVGAVAGGAAAGAYYGSKGVRAGVGYAGERARAFRTGIAERARAVGRAIAATPGAISSAAAALSQSAQTRLNNIQQWFAEGKDKLVGQIKQLQANAAALKEKLTAAGTRPFNDQEQAEINARLRALESVIGALATTGVVPVASAQAPRASWVQRMYEKSKRAVTAPIQKTANSWRQFKVKMNCLGNKACTVEQRREAHKSFLKVYFTIYALFVLAIYGTVLGVVISEMVQEERAREQRAVAERQEVLRSSPRARVLEVPRVAPMRAEVRELPQAVEPIELYPEVEEQIFTPAKIRGGAIALPEME